MAEVMVMRRQGQSTHCRVSHAFWHRASRCLWRTMANPILGVMRFLQLEWHNHERARNAWDIERAEMKAKIAKQEGEVRSAKKLNDQLNKHIRMLEQALMNERAKAKSGAVGGDATEEKKDAKGKKAANAVKREYCDTVDSKWSRNMLTSRSTRA
jgi:hypothetical protein